MFHLNSDQENIVKFVHDGHNTLITGQAGVGKSEVVKEIIKRFKEKGKNISVVCFSGIACLVYKRGVASSVHSHYGFQTANIPWKQVIGRSAENSVVRSRLKSADVIIWDEASMSSQRIFELVNALYHEVAEDEQSRKRFFAGKQVILVGEFLQLKPVPNTFDYGNFMFESPIFVNVIPHRFELTQVMRQSDEQFLAAISELRMGKCSTATREFLLHLSRELPSHVESDATHIFFRKGNAMLHNRLKINELPGELLSFSATYENDASRDIMWPGYRVLQLKPDCKVMLISNKSDDLRNGSIGTFRGVTDDALLVLFEGVGEVEIRRETWFKINHQGVAIGSVSNFPIIPAYAVTCHKSQGLTLPAAVIHCSKEYVPGLIYVAVSRVRSPDCIQVLNFNESQLLPPDPDVVGLCSATHTRYPSADLTCCSQQECPDDKCFTVIDSFCNFEDEIDDQLYFPTNMFDGPVSASFEDLDNPEVQVAVELIEIYEHIANESSNLALPSLECVKKLKEYLVSIKSIQPSAFIKEQNNAIEHLVKAETDVKLHALISIIWNHVCKLIGDHVALNADDIVFNIGRQHFTDTVAGLHQFYISDEFSKYIGAIFSCEQPTAAQRTVIIQLSNNIFEVFLQELLSVVRNDYERLEVPFKVDEMSGEGRSKVRYIGGWAIRKIITKYREYVKANMFSVNSDTLSTVCMKQQLCNLLEENVMVPFAKLEHSSNYPETLQITEERQYRERGLLHISDEAYQFFMVLEQKRVDLLNMNKLQENKENMVEKALDVLTKNSHIRRMWFNCFPHTEDRLSLIETMLKNLLFHYINMGASQFLRDFRLAYRVKKNAELRKKVQQRKQKQEEKANSVAFEDILTDRSVNKQVSHGRLVAFVEKHNDAGLCRVYKKDQLIKLCKAYGVDKTSRCNKKVLSIRLINAIKSNPHALDIFSIDDRQYTVTENVSADGHIRLRISLSDL